MNVRTQLRKRLLTVLDRFGVLELALDTHQTLRRYDLATLRRNARYRRLTTANGEALPIPGAMRLVSVAGTADVEWFLTSGARGADCIRGALARRGTDLRATGPFLDFGCGCGRVIRHFMSQPPDNIAGADMNRSAVRWCRRRLAKGTFVENDAAPPLPFPDQRFGLAYAFSVFTHLPETLQVPWLEELSRLLRSGGLLLVSTHGDTYRNELETEQQSRFDAGELVVRGSAGVGSNYVGAYHPISWMHQNLPPSLDLVEHIPMGALGNPDQDLWVFEKC